MYIYNGKYEEYICLYKNFVVMQDRSSSVVECSPNMQEFSDYKPYHRDIESNYCLPMIPQ